MRDTPTPEAIRAAASWECIATMARLWPSL